MSSRCFVEFDRSNATYYSGEMVTGQFVLHITKNIAINSEYILLRGEGKVLPYQNASSPMRNGSVKYVKTRVDFYGGRELPLGTYNYPFNLLLPSTCPSSCEAPIGSISYTISLVLERILHSDDVFKEPIKVIEPYVLNRYRELKLPIEDEFIKSFCCWPFSSGPVILSLKIPFGGYVPGQKINCTVCIDNQAVGNDLLNVRLSFTQIMRFGTTAPDAISRIRTREYILKTCLLTERVNRLSKRLIQGTLKVPPVPPSTRKDQMIQIRYVVAISVQFGTCSNWNIDTPIVIGTEPLTQSIQDSATDTEGRRQMTSAPTASVEDTEWIPQTPDTPTDPVQETHWIPQTSDTLATESAELPPSYDNYLPPSFNVAANIGENPGNANLNGHNTTNDSKA